MIDNFSYVNETFSVQGTDASIDALMAGMSNFTYHGTGTLDGKTYDKIWDYTGFSDVADETWQIEWFAPVASNVTGYGFRILKNGVEYTASSATRYFVQNGSAYVTFTHFSIQSGENVVLEQFYWTSGNYIYSCCLYRATVAQTGETYRKATVATDSQGNTIGGSFKVGGLYVGGTDFYAQPISFGNEDTKTFFINDATTVYAIEYRETSVVYQLGSDNMLQNGRTVSVNGHDFVRFGAFAAYSNVDIYGMWFRIS